MIFRIPFVDQRRQAGLLPSSPPLLPSSPPRAGRPSAGLRPASGRPLRRGLCAPLEQADLRPAFGRPQVGLCADARHAAIMRFREQGKKATQIGVQFDDRSWHFVHAPAGCDSGIEPRSELRPSRASITKVSRKFRETFAKFSLWDPRAGASRMPQTRFSPCRLPRC